MKLRWLSPAVLVLVTLVACKKDYQSESSLNPEEPSVAVVRNHLAFGSRADFDNLFKMSYGNRQQLLSKLESAQDFTSMREASLLGNSSIQRVINGCSVPDSVIEDNADFFATLDRDGVIQIGSDLFRVDYCNEKVFVIAASVAYTGSNYSDFLSGNLSNSNVGWFYSYVDVQDAVGEGYRSMPDTNSVADVEMFKKGAPSGKVLEWKYFYDVEDEGESSPSNTRMDGKLAYDKWGIYFHFYGKEKYQRHTYLGWQTVSYGTRNWRVEHQYQYQRKGQGNTSGSGTINAPSSGENKVDKTFYSGSRGLLKYYARWDVRNYTNYHSIRRKSDLEFHIGTYQAFPDSPIYLYNYSFNQIINYGSPNYYVMNFGY